MQASAREAETQWLNCFSDASQIEICCSSSSNSDIVKSVVGSTISKQAKASKQNNTIKTCKVIYFMQINIAHKIGATEAAPFSLAVTWIKVLRGGGRLGRWRAVTLL